MPQLWFALALGEDETRRKLVEKALSQAGWSPVLPYKKGIINNGAIEEYPTEKGPADYVLIDRSDPRDEREFDSSLKEIEENCRIVGVGLGKTFLT